MATLFNWLYQLIAWAIYLYMIMIAVWALLSWFPGAQNGRLGRVLDRVVQPYIGFFQRFVPPLLGVDFSPLLGFFGLYLLQETVNFLFALML